FAGNELAQILEMDMTRHELGKRVDDGNDRLAEIGVLHSGGAPKPAGAGHVAAVGGGPRTVCGHDRVLGLCALHGTSRRLGELGARSLPFANCIREPLANFPTVGEVANCDGLASRPASILIVIQTTLYPSYMSLDAVCFGRALRKK